MSYPADLWVFDETSVVHLLKELKEKPLDEFLATYEKKVKLKKLYDDNLFELVKAKRIKDDISHMDEYFGRDIQRYKENRLKEGDSLLKGIINLSGARRFDLNEFSHFEYLGFWYVFEERGGGKQPKGLEVVEKLFSGHSPNSLFGIPLFIDTMGIQGYVSSKLIQEQGKDAMALIKDIEISLSNRPLFKDIHGGATEDDLEFFEEVKEKVLDALEFAKKQKCGIILTTS